MSHNSDHSIETPYGSYLIIIEGTRRDFISGEIFACTHLIISFISGKGL